MWSICLSAKNFLANYTNLWNHFHCLQAETFTPNVQADSRVVPTDIGLLEKPTTLVTRVRNFILYAFCPSSPCAMLTKHFDLTQVCIWLFFNIERGNGGAGTYSIGITVMSSCFCHFPTQFVHGCRFMIHVKSFLWSTCSLTTALGQGACKNSLNYCRMYVSHYWYTSPATQAVKKHATVPAIRALKAILDMSGMRLGAIGPKPPSITPIDAILANPQRA